MSHMHVHTQHSIVWARQCSTVTLAVALLAEGLVSLLQIPVWWTEGGSSFPFDVCTLGGYVVTLFPTSIAFLLSSAVSRRLCNISAAERHLLTNWPIETAFLIEHLWFLTRIYCPGSTGYLWRIIAQNMTLLFLLAPFIFPSALE